MVEMASLAVEGEAPPWRRANFYGEGEWSLQT